MENSKQSTKKKIENMNIGDVCKLTDGGTWTLKQINVPHFEGYETKYLFNTHTWISESMLWNMIANNDLSV